MGAVSLACLARDGHEVVGVDVDPAKLDLIARREDAGGRGGHGRADGRGRRERPRARHHATSRQAVRDTELSLVCVGTPSAPNGSQDQSAILRLAANSGEALARARRPARLRLSLDARARNGRGGAAPILERASGKARRRRFPRVLPARVPARGHVDQGLRQAAVHDRRRERAMRPVSGAARAVRPPAVRVPRRPRIRAAEMVKYCCNNFHALKITFANETARLCEALGVDPFEVMDLVCKDRSSTSRRAYLQARASPSAARACRRTCARRCISRRRATSSCRCSASSCRRTAPHRSSRSPRCSRRGKRRVGMIGLSFKSGTDDLRESPLVILAEHFIGKGLPLLRLRSRGAPVAPARREPALHRAAHSAHRLADPAPTCTT